MEPKVRDTEPADKHPHVLLKNITTASFQLGQIQGQRGQSDVAGRVLNLISLYKSFSVILPVSAGRANFRRVAIASGDFSELSIDSETSLVGSEQDIDHSRIPDRLVGGCHP